MTRAPKPFIGTHPVTINEGFKCSKCGKINPRADKSCRNHCTDCLYSLHVDKTVPGDRESTCMGLMEPVKTDYNAKKGVQILHVCIKCGKEAVNKAAPDDDTENIASIMERQNTTHEHQRVCLKNNRFAPAKHRNQRWNKKPRKF